MQKKNICISSILKKTSNLRWHNNLIKKNKISNVYTENKIYAETQNFKGLNIQNYDTEFSHKKESGMEMSGLNEIIRLL